MEHTPTAEQQSAIDAFATGDNTRIYAGAGTGKTATLRFIANSAKGKNGLYAAFNKSVAEEARRRFAGTGAVSSTIHSLAYREFGAPHRDRLNQKFLFPAQQKALIGCDTRFPMGTSYVSWQTIVRLVRETVTQFCRTMDEEITTDLVTLPPTVIGPESDREELRAYVAELARVWWADVLNPNGALKFEHDYYLKFWALSKPQLPYDYILVDEAQDLEPLTRGVLMMQDAQIVAVGDPQQSIYQWRGATNSLDSFGGERTVLSQSFRFGEAIAEEANFWLSLLESDMRLTGMPGKASSVWPSQRMPEAVLTRTNGGAMEEIMASQRRGMRVHVAGERKAMELQKLAEAALDLQTKGKTNHRDLDVFTSWADVVAFTAEGETDGDLAALVKVVDSYGAAAVVSAMKETVSQREADQTISTVHVAKGLEWLHVRISDDFREPPVDRKTDEQKPLQAEEARLAYVAVTRAERHLDSSGLDWAKRMTGGVALDAVSSAVAV